MRTFSFIFAIFPYLPKSLCPLIGLGQPYILTLPSSFVQSYFISQYFGLYTGLSSFIRARLMLASSLCDQVLIYASSILNYLIFIGASFLLKVGGQKQKSLQQHSSCLLKTLSAVVTMRSESMRKAVPLRVTPLEELEYLRSPMDEQGWVSMLVLLEGFPLIS